MTEIFPPPGYIQTDSALDGIDVFMPAPPESESHQEVVDFDCPQCGATTAFNSADGGLTCSHCGYYEAPQGAVVGKGAEQFEFTLETMERSAQGWGEARKEMECKNCGAFTSVPVENLTHSCPFCGSNKVIQREAPQDILRPRFLIPFKVDSNSCIQIAAEWLGSSWMTPASLKNIAQRAVFVGIYLPYWTFDAVTRADWKAEVGHKETKHYFEDGEWKTRSVIVWRWESGQVRLPINALVVEGTDRLSRLLLEKINNFDLEALAPYEPKYLAGLQAQAYDVPLEKAWEDGRRLMREQTKQACISQASTSKVRNFSMNLDFGDETWRYVLLPVYLATYPYQKEVFQVMVNGQTGAIAGQRPVDWNKVWLAVGLLVSPGLLLGLIGMVTLIIGGIGMAIGGVGFVLLIIGLIISIFIIRQAYGLDDI